MNRKFRGENNNPLNVMLDPNYWPSNPILFPILKTPHPNARLIRGFQLCPDEYKLVLCRFNLGNL